MFEPTYYVAHPDGTYSVADPQPVSQEPVIELFLSQSGTIAGTGGKVYGLSPGWNKLYAAPVQQAEQEPVYAFRRKGQDSFCTCDKERYEELADKPNLFEVTTFYAAPVQQAKQEPVAWCWMLGECAHIVWGSRRPDDAIHTSPLYAAPVRTKDLTDVEVEKVWRKHGGYMVMPIDFARAVIAADREKNRG